MIISNIKRHPNNTKTDQLPISEVITGLPRPYHNISGIIPGRYYYRLITVFVRDNSISFPEAFLPFFLASPRSTIPVRDWGIL